MAALDFPSTGLVANVTTYTANGKTWLWDGTSWISRGSTYTASVGDGTNTIFSISHNLGKSVIVASIREVSSGYYVYPDIKYVDSNTLQLEFASAPTANQYSLTVVGF